ncbi:MAG: Omp28-related outer membrane protein [candidate division Zixibacteria bacterium]|nr:Omp28-related outer membrane protein [candidate division Zixibacteria bacterium]
MHQIYLGNPGRFAAVEYHPTWGYDSDPFANADADARCAYYKITVTPTAVFDGAVTSQPYTRWPDIFNQRKGVASPLEMKLKITTSGDNFTLKANIKRQGAMAGSGLRFHCAVTEQNLSYGGHTYHHVLRKMYPNAGGTAFAINNNETKQIVVSGKFAGSWKRENLHFVVWAQNYGAKEVYQARLATWKEVAVEPSSIGRVKAVFK